MKLAVIIPVYNVRDYIAECIESLKIQKTNITEFILVDDGSKDDSIIIAERVIGDDDRFKIFKKENGGVSEARKFALEKTDADYVFFLDSDDKVSPETLGEIEHELLTKNIDMIVFNMLFWWSETNETKVVKAYKEVDNDMVKGLLLSTPSASNKVFKRELLDIHPFPHGLFYEDLGTVPMYYIEAENKEFIDKEYYIYRQRAGSIIYTFSEKNLDIFKELDRIFNYYKESNNFEKYYDELEYLAIEHLLLHGNRRFIHSNNADKYLAMSKEYIKHWFPNWKKNKYFKEMSLNDKLFIFSSATGKSIIVNSLLEIKHLIKK